MSEAGITYETMVDAIIVATVSLLALHAHFAAETGFGVRLCDSGCGSGMLELWGVIAIVAGLVVVISMLMRATGVGDGDE